MDVKILVTISVLKIVNMSAYLIVQEVVRYHVYISVLKLVLNLVLVVV